MLVKRLAVIGIGLIGGSFARGLRAAGAVGHVTGFDVDPAELAEATRLGVIDTPSQSVADAAEGSDVIVLAVPLGQMARVLKELAPALMPHAVVTDVGSAKVPVVNEAREILGDAFARFVPGHPIAGTENNGVKASRDDLFTRHRVILTPISETSSGALDLVRALWTSVGAEVECMGDQRHDEILAATSHLPHVLAYALVYNLARSDDTGEIFKFAAGGFADFTRIASSRPEVWRDIVFSNSEAILRSIERFEADLQHLTQTIRAGNAEELLSVLRQAKTARDAFQVRRNESLRQREVPSK